MPLKNSAGRKLHGYVLTRYFRGLMNYPAASCGCQLLEKVGSNTISQLNFSFSEPDDGYESPLPEYRPQQTASFQL